MNWRIAVPVVVLVGAAGYIIYGVVRRPAYQAEELLPVFLKRVTDTLLDKRNSEKVAGVCSPAVVKACDQLLVEIAAREAHEPGFRWKSFAVKAGQGIPGSQPAKINLLDAKDRVFLVLECRVAQLPDKSYRITELKWYELLQL